MDARTKAVKAHRTRQRKHGLRRVEVTVRSQDVALVREMANALRRDDSAAGRLRTAIRESVEKRRTISAWDVFNSLPDISGPEFDAVFDEIERFRHDPMMTRIRDVES